MRALLIPLIVSVGLGGCEPNAPTEVASRESPRFNIANAPDVSGIVVREGYPAAVVWIDPKAGTIVVIGVDIVDFCNGTVDFEVAPFQDVIQSNGRDLFVGQGTDMQTSVWPFAAFDCGQFTTTTPLATGVSDLVWTDNDWLYPDPPDLSDVNAFGYEAHGFLTRPGGAAAVFSGHWRAMCTMAS